MNTAAILKLISALLPEGVEIASMFIHNPESQHKFSLILGTAEALFPVVSGIMSAPAAAAPVAAPIAAVVDEPFIPAGVPSAHAA